MAQYSNWYGNSQLVPTTPKLESVQKDFIVRRFQQLLRFLCYTIPLVIVVLGSYPGHRITYFVEVHFLMDPLC